ncbi:MAG: DUF411 domain-containing protein [Gemmatimonadetes bacterium]|uniref:DUF411 domain-containing protein n=1 Tax=Candidatus Tanganyikabacteria bacterium TaxID=2961651 RepID=A0A937X774_9BACT|nr:DUF411 domain-containing protein [Candidatus Tanganyikabacteria bacterium]MBM4186835.1 DUF411 domain-containing protein [Gemmatimonadota bacterium]
MKHEPKGRLLVSHISRRDAVATLAAGLATIAGGRLAAQAKPALTVYKDPNCGCCAKWADHMKANGFTATVKDTADMPAIKAKHHVGDALQSCHTTLVGDYVIEGHVPAVDVKRLLAEKPKGIVGLTIPGMPASAPGMDLTPFKPYDVLTFDVKGKTTVFAKHTKL